MEMLHLMLALMLPWALGATWMRVLLRHDTPGVWFVILGYGYILGTVATALLLLAMDALGAPLRFLSTVAVLGVLSLAGLWPLCIRPRARPTHPVAPSPPSTTGIPWQRVAVACLLALIALRLTGFALEIVWRPLFPWDAWMNWALKSRVWFEHGQLVMYLSPGEWLTSPGALTYTGSTWDNTHYPPLVPLIHLWIALAAGHWSETLINLPWLGCGIGLLLAFYGQLRSMSASPLLALLFCYLLVSMPLFGTHIALAGYAELWLAALYALAAMAFIRWSATRSSRQGLLALVCIAALPFVKQPGIVWALTFIPALLAALMPVRMLAVSGAVVIGILATFYYTTGISLRLPQLGEIALHPGHIRLPGYVGDGLTFYPVWEPFLQNLLVLGNWHLFWFLLPMLLLAGLPSLIRRRELRTAIVLASVALAFLFVVFFLTERYSREALDYATINRALLHAVPTLLFATGLIVSAIPSDWFSRRRSPSDDEGPRTSDGTPRTNPGDQ